MAEEPIDTRLLERLTEQVQDLDRDARRITRDVLADYAEQTMTYRRWWQRGGVLMSGAAAAMLFGGSRALGVLT
ncbi:hypothetical protein [Streptomyces sp. NPDC093984]|uniref:hypothetical protein n=1 Tax=Streptomyces sp. NPDC093984 TaxID=3366052 RepID=UPI0037F3C4D0